LSAAQTIHYRFERKFVVHDPAQRVLDVEVRLNPACFRPLFQPRTVNNIYLDSPNLRFYSLNLDGAAERTKVRIRWYGETFSQVVKPVLELKIKHGLLGRKESFPLAPFMVDQRFSDKVLRAAFRESALPLDIAHLVEALEPSLVNRYHRAYYISGDRHFRLTLDSGLEFFQVRGTANAFLCRAPRTSLRVVELKYDQAQAADAHVITDALPFRLARMSKYALGVDSVNGY
jgi:SPX domain protein involved in polyphosphate accumulation